MMMVAIPASIFQLASSTSTASSFAAMTTMTTIPTTLHSSSLPLPLSLSSSSSSSIVIGNLFTDTTHNVPAADMWIYLSTLGTEVYNTVITITTTTTIPIPDITTIFSTILFVTVSDMIPFVPCQPLAISLATVYGIYAYPICVIGQTCAGIIAFQSSRLFSNTEKVQNVIENLNEDSNELFQNFQNKILKKRKQKKNKNDDKSERSKGVIGEVIGTMTKRRSNGDGDGIDTTDDTTDDDDNDTDVDEWTVFLALVGLRFAPFFPFSAGNYLLGGATTVTIRSFIVATILGCLASNAISVLIGMGVGIELLQQQQTSQ